MKRFLLLALCLVVFARTASASLLESELGFRRYTTLDGLPQMQTETVWQDSRGYIYIGTLSGFVRYDGRTLTPFLQGRRENIVGFQEVDGKVRALGFVRQWMQKGKRLEYGPIDPGGGLLLNNLNAADLPPCHLLLEDREERNRVLCRLTEDGWEPLADSPLLDGMTPDRKLYLDGTGLYVPTPQGLYRTEGYQTHLLSRKTDVYSLIRTADGLLALAEDGVWQVTRDSLVLQYACRFPDPDYGLSVRQDSHGRLLIADAHTIWRYDARDPEPMRRLVTGINLIRGLFIDRWDRLWAATYQGAYCFFHGNFTNHRLTDRNDIVRAVGVSDGRLVTGTLNGKVLVDGESVHEQAGNFYAAGAAVLQGRVYLAGNGDIAAVEGKTLRWLGFPRDSYRFVTADAERLVIGTRGSVLAWHPENGRLDTLTADIARPWCAAGDGQGRLWVSGTAGLFCLTRDLAGKPSVRLVKPTPGTQVITAMASDGQGRVCFARGDSLFLIHGGVQRAMDETRSVLSGHEIRSVHVSARDYLVAAAIDGLLVARLDSAGRSGDIHWFDRENGFTTIEPLQGPMAEDGRGRVWLAGLEDMVSFDPAQLLSDNQEPTVVPELRPWWQRPWLWLAVAGVLSVIVGWCVRLLERRRNRLSMERLDREKRQKELQLSAVRLKAIPHFHANVLAAIEYFVLNNSADEASHYLKLYSDFTNKTLSDIDRPARSVAEEVDYVRSYLELERLRYGERLHYSILVSPEVDPQALLPNMLLHTYCENAVKHGIAAKAGPGNILVAVSRERRDGVEGILAAVSDDGIGRAEAARSGGYSSKQGLKILQQQIELYNRANRHPIIQGVTDLADEAGRPVGTRFETWVPSDFQF